MVYVDMGIVIAIVASPLWVPIAFLAYAIARRRFSLAFLFLFVTAEAVSLGVSQLLIGAISQTGFPQGS